MWVVEQSLNGQTAWMVISMHGTQETASSTRDLYFRGNDRHQYRVRRIASLDAIALLTSWQSSATTPSLPTA